MNAKIKFQIGPVAEPFKGIKPIKFVLFWKEISGVNSWIIYNSASAMHLR